MELLADSNKLKVASLLQLRCWAVLLSCAAELCCWAVFPQNWSEVQQDRRRRGTAQELTRYSTLMKVREERDGGGFADRTRWWTKRPVAACYLEKRMDKANYQWRFWRSRTVAITWSWLSLKTHPRGLRLARERVVRTLKIKVHTEMNSEEFFFQCVSILLSSFTNSKVQFPRLKHNCRRAK